MNLLLVVLGLAILGSIFVHSIVARERRLDEGVRRERLIDEALEAESREIAERSVGVEHYCADCRRMVYYPIDHQRECFYHLDPLFEPFSEGWNWCMNRRRERDAMYSEIEKRS